MEYSPGSFRVKTQKILGLDGNMRGVFVAAPAAAGRPLFGVGIFPPGIESGQKAFDDGEKLVGISALDDEMIRPAPRDDFQHLSGERCLKDDGGLLEARRGFEGVADLKAGHVSQFVVEDDESRPVLSGERKNTGAVV